MSRLRELMEELCPKGVEYRSIKDCVEIVEKIQWNTNDETYYYILKLRTSKTFYIP